MFRKKKAKFSFDDKWLIEQVSGGNKPGCCVPITKEAERFSKNHDLVVVLKSNAFGDKVAEPNELAISRKITVRSLCLLERLHEFSKVPELVECAKVLCQKIEDKIVAEAIAYLYSYHRLDDNKNPYPNNMARPEVALLLGLLFGYRVCCIRYYLETRYFGAPRYLEKTAFNKSGVYLGVLCENCLGDYEKYCE